MKKILPAILLTAVISIVGTLMVVHYEQPQTHEPSGLSARYASRSDYGGWRDDRPTPGSSAGSAWTVPWMLRFDKNGNAYLPRNPVISESPGGTLTLEVIKRGGGGVDAVLHETYTFDSETEQGGAQNFSGMMPVNLTVPPCSVYAEQHRFLHGGSCDHQTARDGGLPTYALTPTLDDIPASG